MLVKRVRVSKGVQSEAEESRRSGCIKQQTVRKGRRRCVTYVDALPPCATAERAIAAATRARLIFVFMLAVWSEWK